MKTLNEYVISEQYSSNNDLFEELYKAIKPVFKRFDILEKYWADNLDGFVADFKNKVK